MNKKLIGLFAVLTFSTVVVAQGNYAQDKSKLTPKEALQIADRYYGEGQFYTAADLYRQYLEKKTDDPYATFWLAMSLNFARDYKGAETAFNSFYSLSAENKKDKGWQQEVRREYDEGRLYYGMILHRLGKYPEAKEQLSKFRGEYSNTDEAERKVVLTLAKRISNSCDSIQFVPKAKVKVVPLPAGVNHGYSETGAYGISDKELYYTSTGADELYEYVGNNELYTSIYKVTKKGQKWGTPQKIDFKINEPGYFNCDGKFNKDKTRFYFSRCIERERDIPLCNLFWCPVNKGVFGAPERLPDNVNHQDSYSSWQPAVRATKNKNQEYIYFVSDRPGGVGGYDIWYTMRTNGSEYTEPALAQGYTNTAGDEVSPYWDDSTQTLYFSSNGHTGFGGFDVFRTRQVSEGKVKKWTAVENLGKPLNSGADDLFYTVAPDLTWGYFTSNREGSIPLNGISTASDDIYTWENFQYAVSGSVKREGTNEEVTTATPGKYSLYKKTADGKKVLVGIDSTSTGGNYFFKLDPDADYEVVVDKPGFLAVTESISTKGIEGEDTLQQNFTVNKDAYQIIGDLYEDGKPDTKVFGPATVIVYETFADGQERMLQESSVSPKMFQYSVKVPTDKTYKVLIRREGYFAGFTTASTKNLPTEVEEIRKDIGLKKLELNKEYKMSNILYEFGKAVLSKSSESVLDTLYGIMVDNPSFVVELSAHTDAVGSDANNLRLSQARAQSCVDYLISKGVNKKRLVPVGYGETRPIAPNNNEDGSDNPDGRTLNRRTEFKILKM